MTDVPNAADDAAATDFVPDFTPEPPTKRPRRRRSLALRFTVAFVLGLLLAVGLGAGALYAWGQQYQGLVLPGVRIGSTELGGLTPEQAAAAIDRAYAGLASGEIALTDPDGDVTTISYAQVGRGPDTAALVAAAMAAGHHGEPLASLIAGPQAAIHGVTLDSAVAYDRDKLSTAVAHLASTIDLRPTDATVSAADGGTFAVAPAKEGRAVDREALVAALDRQLAALDAPASIAVDVPMVAVAPTVTTETAQAAKASADRMAADVVVKEGKDHWTVDGAKLAKLISFSTATDGTITTVFDEAGLDPVVERLAKKAARTAKDAGLKRVGGHIVATGKSHEGRRLIKVATKAAIVRELAARQGGSPASTVAAVAKALDPKLSTADAKRFAPKMKVISSFSVYYQVIINNHFGGNIEAPATKINGTVVPPGGKFDFWEVVGDLRKLPGTGPGNAIEGGKITVTGAFGGGICTTSTTLFNAAFRAGMIPLARQNHNEYITRYPAGLDATVWIVGNTKQTMSFRNDTAFPILIQRVISQDGGRRWLTFKIWSVPNHRTYKISNTVIQHGPKARSGVQRDPSKPVGYRYLNNAPADGAKVWTTVSIYDHGKLHWRKRYFSDYPAVNGVTIVGTRGAS
jgi:vancomycin resistance protein YoaR